MGAASGLCSPSARFRGSTRNLFAGSVSCLCHPDFVKGGTNHLTPGQRVAYYRRRRGMSQFVLAELVGKTVSWIEKI